jgi:hypothetical protein
MLSVCTGMWVFAVTRVYVHMCVKVVATPPPLCARVHHAGVDCDLSIGGDGTEYKAQFFRHVAEVRLSSKSWLAGWLAGWLCVCVS